jgi:hypothetical protein
MDETPLNLDEARPPLIDVWIELCAVVDSFTP